MDRDGIKEAFDQASDQALLFHGFTDYSRDYEVIVWCAADPRTGIQPAFERYLFRYCVSATTTTTLSPEIWRGSWDERLLDVETGNDLDGMVWGIRWQPLLPGMRLLDRSKRASKWSQQIGQPFHEAVVEANAHRIELIFSDLEVTEVPAGYSPFTTR